MFSIASCKGEESSVVGKIKSDIVANTVKKFSSLQETTPATATAFSHPPVTEKPRRTLSFSPQRIRSNINTKINEFNSGCLTKSEKQSASERTSRQIGNTRRNVYESRVSNESNKKEKDKDSAVERHLNTSSSFKKAAAFWNNM